MTQINSWLSDRVKQQADQLALSFQSKTWNFAEINTEVQQYVNYLLSISIQKNVKIAILAQNSEKHLFLVQAIAQIQAVAILLNTRSSFKELSDQLEASKADWLIYDQANIAIANQVALTCKLHILNIDKICLNYAEATNNYQSFNFNLDRTQAILFTSGTSGKPKLIQLSFANHFYSAIAVSQRLEFKASDRSLVCLPLFHIGGLAMLWRCLILGMSLVLLHRFDLELVNQAILEVNHISLTPTMLLRIINDSGFVLQDWQKLSCILLGGEAASPELIQTCLRLKLPIAPTYGMTEAASQIATLKPQDLAAKPNSVGKPLSCNQLKILATDSTELDPNQIGEIVVKGKNIASQDWFYTGDLGYLDSDRYLYVLQRRTDLIISGGENIYPSQIEQILIRHLQIKEVCVVAKPDQKWGQSVAAVIVSNDQLELEELQTFCLAQGLAKYKLPKWLYRVEELPKTASGKIKRDLVRESILIEA